MRLVDQEVILLLLAYEEHLGEEEHVSGALGGQYSKGAFRCQLPEGGEVCSLW